jgi:sarcosine oxidase delta subunit
MTHLRCPFCGVRPVEEFSFHKTLPNVAGGPFADTFLRSDDPQDSHEHWQHRLGCRAWLLTRRNPSTGEVLELRLLGGAAS